MQDALSRKSVVPVSRNTNKEGLEGPPREYAAGSLQMAYRVNKNPEDFAAIKKRFEDIKDHSGRSMQEVCDEYWRKKLSGR